MGKVATSPTAYTPGTLVSKEASVCMKKIRRIRHFGVNKEINAVA
jgi:hypothetical protein